MNKITIGALLRHLILAKNHWFEALNSLEAGTAIPFPQNAAFLEKVEAGQILLDQYRERIKLM